MMEEQLCRFCKEPLKHTVCDLGKTPLANAYLKSSEDPDPSFPLCAKVCARCFLVQVGEYQSPDVIFSDYAYFSSYSLSWLKHAEAYVEQVSERFGLNSSHFVMELASNDGYLLQFFKEKQIPALGVEPAANVAKVAQEKGIDTISRFFGVETAKELASQGKKADLLVANNVVAHVPNLNDFIAGMPLVLQERGVITLEFQHLLQLMKERQFDTIYHEHFCYHSLLCFQQVLGAHGLEVFDVQELPTHGGSLRLFVQKRGVGGHAVLPSVERIVEDECAFGLDALPTYERFNLEVQKVKRDLLKFLRKAKREGRTVVGYGAPAKGNTLLNYCGITQELLPYTVDVSPHKQGKFLPGSHIPIFAPEKVFETKPDYLLILPWNLKEEVMEQMKTIRKWGAQFVIPIPTTSLLR